ncbi:IS30 family transposase [Pseudemcibacter aquimaris]|uniref:IS30 family transposase n=1 Tax=Pseudemcibacter aquimaris TaxID=2857064 RepID=UPI002013AA65|nr:IS30 family transposase [Pseudemcibacter aquimaris]MCC3862527.1 IS30 family transposase [Pseudemcibacter aquimaris]WDU57790.1 IS30 family transposase [Pseudemcibacter aquimaris]
MGTNYSHLGLTERCEIYRLHADGKSQQQIANHIGRSKSTISRELRRNVLSPGGSYKPGFADRMSWARKLRGSKLERLTPLRDHVLESLAMGHSPEQICGRARRTGSEHSLTPETIYAWIYSPVGRKCGLHKLLPKGKARRGRRVRKKGKEPPIHGRMPIHLRPTKAHTRAEPGHWEADLVHFSGQRASLLTCIDRKSRFLMTQKLPNKTAETTSDALTDMFDSLPRRLVKTMTVDNGGEFYQHQRLPIRTFFCDPHAPWQRGSIENANGVLRRMLPRKTNINHFTDSDINDIMWTYNTTPRKCLDYLTPLEALAKSMGVALEI